MKKYFLLFLMAGFLSLSACSSDDDAETTPETDPIIGTWTLVQVNPPLINAQACDEPSTLTFTEGQTNTSGPASGTFYLEQNDCEPASSGGRWTNTGNSVYTIDVPVLGPQTGIVNFQDSDTFTFASQDIPGLSLTFEAQ